jgi:hypothetical protein
MSANASDAGQRRAERLYHGTSTAHVEAVLREGVRAPSCWGTYEMALWFARRACDESGGHPALVYMTSDDVAGEALGPDPAAVDFPVANVLGTKDHGALGERWSSSAKGWRECLEIYGSVRCGAPVAVGRDDVIGVTRAAEAAVRRTARKVFGKIVPTSSQVREIWEHKLERFGIAGIADRVGLPRATVKAVLAAPMPDDMRNDPRLSPWRWAYLPVGELPATAVLLKFPVDIRLDQWRKAVRGVMRDVRAEHPGVPLRFALTMMEQLEADVAERMMAKHGWQAWQSDSDGAVSRVGPTAAEAPRPARGR